MVGDPAAVRVAAGGDARRRRSSGCRSRCSSPARCSSSPPGVINVQYWYPFKFNFVVAHYYGAVVFVASLVLHVRGQAAGDRAAPTASAGILKPLRDDLAAHGARAARATGWSPRDRRRRRSSRRGLFALRRRGRGAAAGRQRRRSRSAARCAELAFLAPRRDRTGPTASRSTRPPPPRGSRRTMTGAGYRLDAARAARREVCAVPRRAAGAGAAHARRCRSPASRAGRRRRRGPACRSPRSPSAPARRGRARCSCESLQPARRAPPGDADAATQIARRARAAGAEGQRRRPVARPRLPGADHRPGAARRAQHEVGGRDDVHGRRREALRYGASPLHLLAHLALLPLCRLGAAADRSTARGAENVVLWLVAAVILHDLVLLPVYSAARPARAAPRPARRRSTTCASRPGSRCCCCSCSSRSIAGKGERQPSIT